MATKRRPAPITEAECGRLLGGKLMRELRTLDPRLPRLARKLYKAAYVEKERDARIRDISASISVVADDGETPPFALTIHAQMDEDSAFELADRLDDVREALESTLQLPVYASVVDVHWLD